jgi:ArsR family transcriptional regulator, arsenate/arsenite/antimonite-responsive transcriptional repressor
MISGRVFQALADPTRRRILTLLRKRSMGSGEIADAFRTSWPTISRHLSILRDARLVLVERDGRTIRYELNVSVLEDLVQHFLAWTTSEATDAKTADTPRAAVGNQRGRLREAT